MARRAKRLKRAARGTDAAAAAALLGAAAAATAGKVVRDRRARRARKQDRELRLREEETIPDGIRRIARGQIDEAREQLERGAGDDLSEAVHEARKALKRARTVARLARDGVGDDAYSRDNRALRDVGRTLSPARDGHVLVETLDAVRERFGDEVPAEGAAALRDRLMADRTAATEGLQRDGTVPAAVADLDTARPRIAGWSFSHADFRAVEPGLERVYRRGRRAFKAACRDPAPERFHAWRKRVKDLWYAANVVRAAGPKPMKKIARRARSLSKVLGEHHDLTVLRAEVLRHRSVLDSPTAAALLAVVDRRRAELEAEALGAGADLYADKPRKFVRRIERRWTKRMAGAPAAG
jgi:CHAD domain-containing protein